jgi:preprotein translocase subunit SecF
MNWLKFKKYYFLVSGAMLAICIFGLLKWGLKFGVDFKGGTIVEYRFENDVSTEELRSRLSENELEVNSISKSSDDTYLLRFPPLSEDSKEKIASVAADLVGGNVDEFRFETVGPSIGPELIRKTIYAIFISAGVILLWVAYQFKSVKFGASAILAMFHDTFILVGSFSIFGHFFGAEIDFLFVTALLTTLSFSVHDTIVVFDRIREIGRGDDDLESVANTALTETMVRSLNNSFTIAFMLVALLLLGGSTVKWFAGALLIGTILGTYSSPFVAVPVLVSWDSWTSKFTGVRSKIKLPGK